jgi:short-subunit dehydrogenase
MTVEAYDVGRAADSMSVNYLGIVNALGALMPAMLAAGRGHIALVGSIAGYRGLPKAAAYAPSKAAVISLAEVLRLELAPKGIIVSIVNPGFVDTPMTAVNEFPMPYIMKPNDAADRILRNLERGRFEIAFPWQLVSVLKILRMMPNALYLRLAARL